MWSSLEKTRYSAVGGGVEDEEVGVAVAREEEDGGGRECEEVSEGQEVVRKRSKRKSC